MRTHHLRRAGGSVVREQRMKARTPLLIALASALAGCSTMQKGPPASAAHFVDSTESAGIATESARSAGWADYDNDGCVDLLVTQAGPPRLFRNNCNGGFTDATAHSGIEGPAAGMGVSWADYDGDGDLDVYIASTDHANALYRNDGAGRFVNVATSAGVDDPRASTTATWGDYDGDGDLDLFVANRFYPKPESDITDRLYRNNGDGTFTDVGVATGVAVADRKTFSGAWFDYDGNGTLDLYLAVDFGKDRLYSNYGDGRFFDATSVAGIAGPQHAMGLVTGDINGDGCVDLVSTNNTRGEAGDAEHGPSTLYINNCRGGFSDQTTRWGIEDRSTVDWGVNMVDWDNDGDLDLAIVSGGMLKEGEKEQNVLYRNDNGRLVNVTAEAGAVVTGAAFGSAWADYDNDGDLDWLIVNSKRASVLLENRSQVGKHLRIRLRGNGANSDAVGARVVLSNAEKEQVRLIQVDTSYGVSEPLEAHFGVGERSRIGRITVTWPDGSVTTHDNLATGQTVTLTQP